MKLAAWLLLLGIIGAAAYTFWKWRGRWRERKRASEERFASFIAQARPPPPIVEKPRVAETVAQETLLLEAAAKAAEAGEPVLSIQLYARMLARYPDSTFGALARAAVEAQKQKLVKP